MSVTRPRIRSSSEGAPPRRRSSGCLTSSSSRCHVGRSRETPATRLTSQGDDRGRQREIALARAARASRTRERIDLSTAARKVEDRAREEGPVGGSRGSRGIKSPRDEAIFCAKEQGRESLSSAAFLLPSSNATAVSVARSRPNPFQSLFTERTKSEKTRFRRTPRPHSVLSLSLSISVLRPRDDGSARGRKEDFSE